MKKLFYSLLTCLLVAWMAVIQANAVSVVYTVAAGQAWNSTNLVPAAATINSIRVDLGASGGVTNLSYAFTDFPLFTVGSATAIAAGWAPQNITNTAYTQVTQYLTNITRTITNSAGIGQTTFPAGSTITNIITISNVLWSITNTVAATSNVWRRVAGPSTQLSNTVSTITGPFNVMFGLGFTNNNIGKDITLTIDYDSSL